MFIVIEGPDGSGKSTLSHVLTEELTREGHEVLCTSEPTNNSPYGNEVRRILSSGQICTPIHLADLLTEDRKCHLRETILPAIKAGNWVICDRYKYSALAYQQMQGVNPQYLIDINKDFKIPDAVFILIPKSVKTLTQRIAFRNKQIDFFERERSLEVITSYYSKMRDYFPNENIYFLNADLPTSKLAKETIQYLKKNIF